jgi:pyruvate,water dikinase
LKQLKKHAKHKKPQGDRVRRSIDALCLSSDLRERITLSLSVPPDELERSTAGSGRDQLRVTSPAVLLHSPGKELVVGLDSKNPVHFEKVFQTSVVGGKALHLAEMIAASTAEITVPPAAAVTTWAYDAYVASLGLEKALEELLQEEHPDDAVLERRLEKIREQITTGAIPFDLQLQLNAFLHSHHFQGKERVRFAVRSSSTQEDAGASSFAGQYETLLNVAPEEVWESIKKCYASMWQVRLFAYRKNVGFSSAEKLSMAVVVQEQVDSTAAGVAFSLNPVNGNADEVVVESVWGQGEALVGGTITPHQWTVDWKVKKEVKARTKTVQQKKIICLSDSSVKDVDTSEMERATPPLTDAQAIAVADLALSVASLYGVPYDIEYAREKDQIYLLQARPITSFSVDMEGTWDYAGFADSCLLTVSMSGKERLFVFRFRHLFFFFSSYY